MEVVMKKIFIYTGSNNSNSLTKRICDYTVNVLEYELGKVEVKNYKYDTHRIDCCKGCAVCFRKGSCALDELDDMKEMKKDMLSSDIIIFATPVYFMCVSGAMKIFLDRLTYWTHLFRLSKKTGVIIVTGDQNGLKETIEYLYEFCLRLGLINIKIIAYNKLYDTKEYIKSDIQVKSEEIKDYYESSKRYLVDSYQNQMFVNYKSYINFLPDGVYEKEYWRDKGMLDTVDFRTFIKQ